MTDIDPILRGPEGSPITRNSTIDFLRVKPEQSVQVREIIPNNPPLSGNPAGRYALDVQVTHASDKETLVDRQRMITEGELTRARDALISGIDSQAEESGRSELLELLLQTNRLQVVGENAIKPQR